MSKNEDNTYQFPRHLQREYYLLMNSRETFLKKLSRADQRRLIILYEDLENAWHQNHIKELSNILDQKYQELRELQQSINSDYSDLRSQLEKQLLHSISLEEIALEQSKQRLTELQQILTSRQEILNNELQKLQATEEEKEIHFRKESENLLRSKQKLTYLYDTKNQLLANLKTSKIPYQNNLDMLQKELEQGLNALKKQRQQKSDELKQNRESYLEELQAIERSLKEDLNNYEETLMQQLKEKLLLQLQISSGELKNFLMQEDHSRITQITGGIIRENEQLGKALDRELTKIGRGRESFLAWMDRNT